MSSSTAEFQALFKRELEKLIAAGMPKNEAGSKALLAVADIMKNKKPEVSE